VATQAVLGVDEDLDDAVPLQRQLRLGCRPAAGLGFEGVADWHADLVGFALPAVPQHLGRVRPVLVRAGGERGVVVSPHPLLRGGVLRAGAGQVLLDGLRPLGERPQPSGVEAHDLPASVAVRPPLDTEPGGEPATEFFLVDGSGGLGPLVEQRAVERGEAPVRAPAEIGHHRMGVQLRVALPARPVHERGGGDARRDPPPFAIGHLARRPCAALHEVERHGHGFDVGDRRYRRHFRPGEGPQQGHALRRREREVERCDLPAPVPVEEPEAGPGLVADEQRPEVVGVHYAYQAEIGGQVPLPDPGRLARPDVVVLDPDGHRVEEVVGVADPGDRQHGACPGLACDSWQVSVGRSVVGLRG
jgi:hypothetical protein